ncbi:MAG: hypothetical protein AAFX54_17845 [Pseudomonadota bacterium]
MSRAKKYIIRGYVALEFCNENAEQTRARLDNLKQIELLRTCLNEFLDFQTTKGKALLNSIKERYKEYADPAYKHFVTNDLNEDAIRDFRGDRSSLSNGRRMLIHIYLWTSSPEYRAVWSNKGSLEDPNAA